MSVEADIDFPFVCAGCSRCNVGVEEALKPKKRIRIMTDFTFSQLRRLDVTVLLVFLGLLRHRKATIVADELGLTPSGVSQSLRRLRDVFGDPLFLRRPHGMEPTSVALRLETPIAAAVEALRMSLSVETPFEPDRAEGVARIAAFDVEQAILLPGFMHRLARLAPRLKVSVFGASRGQALDGLQAGSLDLALGFMSANDNLFVQHKMFDEGYLVVGPPALIGMSGGIGLADYVRLPHLLVSPGGDLKGIVDETLAGMGLVRNVRFSLPQFFPALAAIGDTGCIATLPSRLAERYAPLFGLATVTPPIEIRRFTVSAVIHRRNAEDPRSRWMIEQLKAVVG
jgi:DNA-binding transcriptional LysR family regulator